MIPGYVEFEFDLPKALLERLAATLDATQPAPLTEESAARLGDVQGVYELFHKGQLVYVGKTDAKAGLRQRLSQHALKIKHRIGLDPSDVSFKAVRIFVFTAMDLEADLIVHRKKRGKLAWDKSGFGNKDPGRKRDQSTVKRSHFDALHRIDTERVIAGLSFVGGKSAADALERLKAYLPYNLRFHKVRRRAHPDLTEATLDKALKPKSVREALSEIVGVLPKGWTVTVLPGYIIFYRERATYPSAQYQIKSA
ncbi:MAG: GIY-YIG nuclease family protein [Tagaea sp.]|nr:GIY-YIG nuclease family protein [Tagaea sp.]